MFKRFDAFYDWLVSSPGIRAALIFVYLGTAFLLVEFGQADHDQVGSRNFYGLAAFVALLVIGAIQQAAWLARRAGGRHE